MEQNLLYFFLIQGVDDLFNGDYSFNDLCL